MARSAQFAIDGMHRMERGRLERCFDLLSMIKMNREWQTGIGDAIHFVPHGCILVHRKSLHTTDLQST